MVASLSCRIAFVGMNVLLLGEFAASKRVVETEPASLLMAQSTQGEKQASDSFSSDLDDVEVPKGSRGSRSHSHHRSKHHRKAGPIEADNEGPFASDKCPERKGGHCMWAMGGDSKNECPERYESVETQSECEDAVEEIGKILGHASILGFHMSENKPENPHGCYRQGGGYYLNTADGAPRLGRSKVCKLMKTYCPPDVETWCTPSVCGTSSDENYDKEHCPTTCEQCEEQY